MAKISTSTAAYDTIEPHLFSCTMLEGAHVDLKEVDENLHAILKLAEEVRYAVLVDARATCTITPEAMEYSKRPESYRLLIAQAIVVDSLPNRLIANFIIKFHKPAAPTKLFSNNKDGIAWLQKCMKEDKEGILGKNNKGKSFNIFTA
jgi:hypothetical protein